MPKTFISLYSFLQSYENNLLEWLNEPWKGKDKQESLLRLFAGLGLIEKLNDYNVCKGNFNLKTICVHNTRKDIFYDEKNIPIMLKDKGDSSDLTCLSKTNDKHILVTTSKNINKLNVGNLDIDKILTNFKQYDEYKMTLCICIRDYDAYCIMKENIENTNRELKKILKKNIIIIDWKDLNNAFLIFKQTFNNSINEILDTNKYILINKFHQKLGVIKTLRMKNENKKKVLWGHIPRSGKSYIIGGCIIEDNKYNYIVITTAPNETIEQQVKIFDCFQLKDFNVIVLNNTNKPLLSDKNIIVCSKQFLQNKNIKWLKNIKFDMRFIDESHNGGTTDLAQKTLHIYGNDCFTVQITATYTKPCNDYNIPQDCWILWDLEDVKLCKFIDEKTSKERLIEKHGPKLKNLLKKYEYAHIIDEYSKYPELWLLTDEIKPEIVTEILNNTSDNYYGWSSKACFLLKQCIQDNNIKVISEFQNETEVLKVWYRIFGKHNKYGITDKDYPDNIVFLKRIERICKNPLTKSRFIGDNNEPMIILAFLPQNNINKISRATRKILLKYNIIPDYDILCINSKTTDNPKQSIEEARISARNSNKKGVLVLSGRQCSLGVSIDNCDIVILLNGNMCFDMIYQMMFRCMTEGSRKKNGYVIDLNIHRVIETTIMNYASIIKPSIHPKEATKYILQERLINLNGDHWIHSFGNATDKITSISNTVYEIYSSNTVSALEQFLNRLRFKNILLTKNEQKIFNIMFSSTQPTQEQKQQIKKLLEEPDTINEGIEKIQVANKTNIKKQEEQDIKYMDILKHIIPLICLLTIHNNETSFIEMFNLIKSNKCVYTILIEQIQSWWGYNIDADILTKFIYVYTKYLANNKETNQIIRTIKELFVKNINNSKQLSKLIDKYLIPQELEKKSNAEVSTPYKLRQEMLNTIPQEFWTTPKKVFEPCAGKGGFVIDIINRFMNGLTTIMDIKIRYKTIIEKCLYFSDINPTNIFICKLLCDPYNEYKLNYDEGNTLELDIQQKWDINRFDAIIGNPPYNKNLYKKFTDFCLDITNILLFVIPSTFTIGVSHKKFIENIKCNGLKLITFLNRNIWNIRIDIDTLYLLCIKDYNGLLCINGIDINRQDKILNIDKVYIEILNKIHIHPKLELLKGKQQTLNFKDPQETDNIKFTESKEYCYKIVSRLNGGRKEQNYYTDIKGDYIEGYKILFPRGTGSYNSISTLKNLSKSIVFSKITNENNLLSTGIVYIKCDTLQEATFIQWYMMYSKFIRFMFIKENKFSELTKGFVNILPKINCIICDDNALYKYLKLTQEEIDLIENIFI